MQRSKNFYEEEAKPLKCIAVDDEPIALNIVKAHISNIPWLRLEATFTSATKAIDYLKTSPADLVFLDINMPDLSGLEMAGMIDSSIQVIFTTAYSEFAVEGFELDATDYLLKPISFERFLKACERVKGITKSGNIKDLNAFDSLFFKDGYHWIRINIPKLIYVEASDNYVLFHGAGKPVMVRMTLSEAMSRLEDKGFVRIHKSYGVAVSLIEKIESNNVIVSGKKIPLSASYKNELLEKLRP